MHICMYIHIRIYIYIHNIYIYINMYIHVYMHPHICIPAYVHHILFQQRVMSVCAMGIRKNVNVQRYIQDIHFYIYVYHVC